ncbi:inosine/xanthosine triphosphatase [Shewanella sp. UCD-FRSSP16_17]|nr:inosine/xanthosine triphosphatase [Shewanella sp. UCD-FRSSP16_17]OBT08399.1 inosine/xanthosine triphosphatase [Shewanella sp. UCD-FRSSP16_17]
MSNPTQLETQPLHDKKSIAEQTIAQMTIIVGSKNPVKVNAAKVAFSQYFPHHQIHCIGKHAPSLVADQPMTEQETKQGAINRVQFCQSEDLANAMAETKADFYIAMEGGVDHFDHGPATFAYMAIIHQQQISIGRSALLPLPAQVYQSLQQGEELGHVMDRLFNTDNIKQKGGAIGLLTQGLATRESIYTQAIILAMAPFINAEIFNS